MNNPTPVWHTMYVRQKDNILDRLEGGDLRSIGSADKVVMEILKKPSLFEEVFSGTVKLQGV
jgi:hypothetical protein